MSKQTIYNYLKQGGLSHNGACAMMGNMYCESLLKSDNVENRSQRSDASYTEAVNNGTINRNIFDHDALGYGLCQWTYYTRKDELWQRTVGKGISVADERAQCDFCIAELKRDYRNLYDYLCGDCDLYKAVERICKEYERPAVNNIGDPVTGLTPEGEKGRYYYAREYANDLKDDASSPGGVPTPTPPQSTESVEITVRVLRKGDMGRDVYLMQRGLEDMDIPLGTWGADGDFGEDTEKAVNDLKESVGLPMDGVVDADVWQIIFQ